MTKEFEIRAFCVVGKHSGPEISLNQKNPLESKSGWRLVPAKCVNGEWIYNRKSLAKISVCPKCNVKGEPELN
jgi:hypothetical protein